MNGNVTNQHGILKCTIKAHGNLTGRVSKGASLVGSLSIGPDDVEMYILVDQNGYEVPAVLVDEKKVFTATANDIRLGTVAATEQGVTTGEKVIPSYHTEEGYGLIPSGSVFSIPMDELYDFTKLQVIICPWAGSIAKSVAAEKVVLDENVYPANSAESLATVTRDSENQAINLGITNESGSLCVVRYFTYKEIG